MVDILNNFILRKCVKFGILFYDKLKIVLFLSDLTFIIIFEFKYKGVLGFITVYNYTSINMIRYCVSFFIYQVVNQFFITTFITTN